MATQLKVTQSTRRSNKSDLPPRPKGSQPILTSRGSDSREEWIMPMKSPEAWSGRSWPDKQLESSSISLNRKKWQAELCCSQGLQERENSNCSSGCSIAGSESSFLPNGSIRSVLFVSEENRGADVKLPKIDWDKDKGD